MDSNFYFWLSVLQFISIVGWIIVALAVAAIVYSGIKEGKRNASEN